jgi:hypothetical protein
MIMALPSRGPQSCFSLLAGNSSHFPLCVFAADNWGRAWSYGGLFRYYAKTVVEGCPQDGGCGDLFLPLTVEESVVVEGVAG